MGNLSLNQDMLRSKILNSRFALELEGISNIDLNNMYQQYLLHFDEFIKDIIEHVESEFNEQVDNLIEESFEEGREAGIKEGKDGEFDRGYQYGYNDGFKG
jgi:flagellar biosynthesis/type III secretory pathway protein FliH